MVQLARQPATATDTPLVEVIIAEPLDARGAAGLRRLLGEALALRPTRLIVDLADCSFVDAAAVNVLLDVHREVWRSGGRVTLRSPSPRLTRLLELTHVDHVFQITHDPPVQPPPRRRSYVRTPDTSAKRP